MLIIADAKTVFAREAFQRLGDVRYLKTAEITRSALHDADAVVVRSETRVGRDLLEGTAVRFVGTATIGTDHIDLDYLHDREIGFASAPGSNANSVAEYMVAALLEFSHLKAMSLQGKTIGIVGVGNVGSKVVRVAQGLGMEVLLNDPPLAEVSRDPKFLTLDEIMDADFISLHVPLTDGGPHPTYHLFGANRIGKMKPGSVLINTARGAVVDTEPLKADLQRGHLGGAILDVWEQEPDIDRELLASVDIGTPHIAGFSLDGKHNAVRMLFDAICGHFGIDAAWKEIHDLPKPVPDQLLAPDTSEGEKAIRQVVSHCYDILQDDRNLRGVLSASPAVCSSYFRALRSDYPSRWEFLNWRVSFPHPNPDLQRILKTLGFRIE
jgi:erythronate-4-phosphate dehydrogenase